jgi:hypothetical protein
MTDERNSLCPGCIGDGEIRIPRETIVDFDEIDTAIRE